MLPIKTRKIVTVPDEGGERYCKHCNTWQTLNEENFAKNGVCYLARICRACSRKKQRVHSGRRKGKSLTNIAFGP